MSSFTERMAVYQAIIADDTTPPLYQPDISPVTHAEESLIKEGKLRFADHTKTTVQLTLNGYKDLLKYLRLGYLTGSAPPEPGQTGVDPVPPPTCTHCGCPCPCDCHQSSCPPGMRKYESYPASTA